MTDSERLKKIGETGNDTELVRIRHEQQEKIQQNQPEHVGEKQHESLKEASAEAMEQAKSRERDQPLQHHEQKAPSKERRKNGVISKKEAAANYKRTMSHVQSELPLPSRAFSKLIHNKAVERISDAVGSTVARPNAILAGSLVAFVFTLGLFLLARYYGYPLSGTETIAAFIVGWMIGLLFDYLKLEFTGGKS
ncbi:MAG: hypothetical protein JWO61_104 [Candidatus Saccharibacteria bacterium]|nr:hypothetical protein [Candidatus Saccharibacteria bacterium]